MQYWTESRQNIHVAAHRGWSDAYPENTMEAFRAAAELGVDSIETDIRISKDGHLVLIHDDTVDRTTNGSGAVKDMTLAQLQALDAGIHKGEAFRGCRIPTLIEFLDYMKDYPRITMDLELKEYPTEGHEQAAYSVCDRTLQLVEEYGFADRVVVNTFSAKLHEYIHQKYGNRYRQHVYFPISCMGDHTADPYAYAFCCCMFGENGQIMASRDVFAAMAARGVEPWAGAGVKDEAGVDMAIRHGAVLITCNNPDAILSLLRQKGKHP